MISVKSATETVKVNRMVREIFAAHIISSLIQAYPKASAEELVSKSWKLAVMMVENTPKEG